MKKLIKPSKRELFLFLLVIALTIFGAIMVYSASSYSALKNYGNQYFFLIKQFVGVFIGTGLMIFFYFFDYHKLKKLKWFIVIFSSILLILVFIPGIGIENYGARRWIGAFGVTIQPSEIAKFAFVIFASAYLSDYYQNIKKFKYILPVLLVGGLFCLLIIVEPNMSITMCMGMVMLIMLFIGGVKGKHFASLCIPAAAAVPVLIFMEPYRIKRLLAFLDPWQSPQAEGFQLIQSLYSLGSGGWFGVGLFNSRQKYLFLPFAESDFIFSIIGEELGFIGAIGIMAVFVIIVVMLIKIALNAKDRFGALLASGIASVIAVQTLINIAVVTGSIPPTGLPLPFISAGGTSIMVFMAAIGVVLNVDRQSRENMLQ